MRLSFHLFDPAPARRVETPGRECAGSLFHDLLLREKAERNAADPGRFPVTGGNPPAQLRPLPEDSVTALGRSRVQSTDVAAFLKLFSSRELVFSRQTLERIRAEGPPGAPLSPTPEDLADLGARYDLAAPLSPREEYGLLHTLMEWGAVAWEDVLDANTTVCPQPRGVTGYLLEQEEFADIQAIPRHNLRARLQAMSGNERFTYEHIRREYGMHCPSILDCADSHQRLDEALGTLSGSAGSG